MPCGRPHFEAHVITDSGFLVFVMSLDLRDLSPEEKMSCLALRCGARRAIELGQQVWLESIEAVRVHEGRYSVPLPPSDSHARKHSEPWLDALLSQSEDDPAIASSQAPDQDGDNEYESEATEDDDAWQTYANNAWVFRATIEPSEPTERTAWRRKINPEINQLTRIARPREFSRALGKMVTEQLGPLCAAQDFRHKFAEGPTLTTKHRSQLVLHGPVIYTTTPEQLIANSPSKDECLIRSLFVEQEAFRHEREYRFVIVSETKPDRDVVCLEPSSALLGSLGVSHSP